MGFSKRGLVYKSTNPRPLPLQYQNSSILRSYWSICACPTRWAGERKEIFEAEPNAFSSQAEQERECDRGSKSLLFSSFFGRKLECPPSFLPSVPCQDEVLPIFYLRHVGRQRSARRRGGERERKRERAINEQIPADGKKIALSTAPKERSANTECALYGLALGMEYPEKGSFMKK